MKTPDDNPENNSYDKPNNFNPDENPNNNLDDNPDTDNPDDNYADCWQENGSKN